MDVDRRELRTMKNVGPSKIKDRRKLRTDKRPTDGRTHSRRTDGRKKKTKTKFGRNFGRCAVLLSYQTTMQQKKKNGSFQKKQSVGQTRDGSVALTWLMHFVHLSAARDPPGRI